MAAIDAIRSVNVSSAGAPARPGATSPGAAGVRPFSQVLKDAVAQVNALQLEAQQMAEAVARGDLTDMHRLALTVERAQLALELTVAVRNKLVEAYQEISRMPV
ncbi:flagellar hook-basal body complex protein FliE [Geochorda subterranea]|uniref:Flagellar hook-basal body complex protein FliE n=1 Tax=Geochorda subterranea TaxID=3109564 RepID=A0ABZ1BKG9_9FIRM|nr:flagellar hook-basal body complex protein FliE [Limnochorda sp. LNt]WRP13341.1 flagellar hook-basal body complex protein FliE [Limnochorda sp. LNt]